MLLDIYLLRKRKPELKGRKTLRNLHSIDVKKVHSINLHKKYSLQSQGEERYFLGKILNDFFLSTPLLLTVKLIVV